MALSSIFVQPKRTLEDVCFNITGGLLSAAQSDSRHRAAAPRRAAFPAGRGGAQSGALCRPQRTVCPPLSRHDMGVEKEKLDTSIIMDEDEYNLSIEPILMKKGKVYSEAPDRDPNEINTHLKVKSARAHGDSERENVRGDVDVSTL